MKKIIALIVAVALLFCFVGCTESTKESDNDSKEGSAAKITEAGKIAEDFYNLYYNGEGAVEKFAPEEFWNFIDVDFDTSVEEVQEFWQENYESNLEDIISQDYFVEEYGKDGKISFEYQDEKNTPKDDFKRIKEALSDKYDIDEDDIEEVLEVDFIFTYEGSDDKDISTTFIYIVKIGDEWYPMSRSAEFAVFSIVSDLVE